VNRFLLLLIFLIVVQCPVLGQSRIYNQEFEFSIDNDAFLIASLDRYYSSGINFERRIALKPENKIFNYFPGLKKAIWGIGIGHNFYTSRQIKEKMVSRFDRPYAGWLYAATYLNLFPNQKSAIKTYIDVGVVGPASGGETVQKWWHETVGLAEPQGWEYQINNTPAINFKFLYQRQLFALSFMDLISESTLQFGTIHNNVRQGAVIRFINMQPLQNSIYSRSKLGNGLGRTDSGSEYDEILEVFLFGGAEIEYVFYNSLIEGNFVGSSSPHIEVASPWVVHWKYGIAFGGHAADIHLSINHLSSETTKSIGHSYFGIDFTFRF